MTAPWPKINTVFVDSENGSRLSEPSTVRAPFTVTGTSKATGWAGLVAGAAGGVVAAEFSTSLTIGAMGHSLERDWRDDLRDAEIVHSYLFILGRAGKALYSTWVLRG